MPRQLPSLTELSPAPPHFASRQAPPLPRCLRAEPKINGCLSDASLDKPRFVLKGQVLQIALPSPPPWLAHICLRLSARAFFAHLPWLAPSCEKATPQQRQQVRERMTQPTVATGHRNGECLFRFLGRSAQHS